MFLQISRIGALSAATALRILIRSDFDFLGESRAALKRCRPSKLEGSLYLYVTFQSSAHSWQFRSRVWTMSLKARITRAEGHGIIWKACPRTWDSRSIT